MKVWVLTVTDSEEHGDGVYTIEHGAYSSEANARKGLANFCRVSWLEQHGLGPDSETDDDDDRDEYDSPLSGDDEKAIERYFEYWTPEQDFEITELEIDAALNTKETPA